MSIDLCRRLIVSGVATAEEIEAALFLSVVRGVPLPRALVDRGAVSERALEEELGRRGGLALRHVVGVAELVARLPPAMCRRLGAVPVRLDSFTGTVDVAAADPLDPHVATEFGFHLGAPIRIIRASISAVEEAIRRMELEEQQVSGSEARSRRTTPAFPHGAPSSSIPPPPDDMPIPLVRRLGVPLVEDSEAFDPDTVPREPVLPLRKSKVAQSSNAGPRPRALNEPEVPPPAVSFPSSPPPPTETGLGTKFRVTQETLRPANAVREAPQEDRRSVETLRPYGSRPAIDLPPLGAIEEGVSGAVVAPDEAPERHTLIGVPPPPSQPFADARPILAALEAAKRRDDVIRLGLEGLGLIARRGAVFAVKRDGFHGWACSAAFGDVERFRKVVVPLDQPSILATATATGVYLGPVPRTPPHAGVHEVMGASSRDVAAVAVRVAGRAVMLLLADELGDTMNGTRRMDELARAMGDALARVLRGS